ncbi:hypothetical protein Tco_0463793, partial [Tanacetum coccineum]
LSILLVGTRLSLPGPTMIITLPAGTTYLPNVEQERFADDSSSKDVNAVGQQVNTASLDVNTGSL